MLYIVQVFHKRGYVPFIIKFFRSTDKETSEGALGTTMEKAAVVLDSVQITFPSPQFGQLVLVLLLFLNAKNVDVSDIQNDSISEILLR